MESKRGPAKVISSLGCSPFADDTLALFKSKGSAAYERGGRMVRRAGRQQGREQTTS